MSTTILKLKDSLSKNYLEVYEGTAGLCFLMEDGVSGKSLKFWFENEESIERLEEAISIYKREK